MKASIDLSAVAEGLENCKPGDEYSVVFTVDTKTGSALTGTASEIEHLSGEYDEDEDEAIEANTWMERKKRDGSQSGSKVPKAILLVSK